MNRQLSPFLDMGFHGDKYLIELVFASAMQCAQFIETGTNVGSSLHYIAKNFPQMACYSCEPDLEAFRFARDKTQSFANVQVYHEPSPEFLFSLTDRNAGLSQRASLFWLDSHGYGFRWPLKEEVSFITRTFPRACVFIDDFKVPGQPQFSFDEYDGQVCGFDHIEASLKPGIPYRMIYPDYVEKTSPFHPLRGWILIEYGFASPLPIPASLDGKLRIIQETVR